MKVLDTKPTLEGHGQAWEMPPKTEPPYASIAYWILRAPWAHPFWHSYVISMVHLRDGPGMQPAKKNFPEATHELTILALDPQHPPDYPDHVRWLSPANLVLQGTFGTDTEAAEWTRKMVQEVLAGTLSPDTDYREAWRIKIRQPDAKLTYTPRVEVHTPKKPTQH